MNFAVCTPCSDGDLLIRFRCSASSVGGTHVMADLLGLFHHGGASIVDWRADVGLGSITVKGFATVSPEGYTWLNRLLANGVRGGQLEMEVVSTEQIATVCIIAVDEPGIQAHALAELAWREIAMVTSRGSAFHGSFTATRYYACNLVVVVPDHRLDDLRADFDLLARDHGWEVCSVERGFQLLDFAATMSLEN